YPTIGASGGVFGLLLAYGMLFPNQRVMLLFPPIPMKARTFVIVFGVIELMLGITGWQPGVAHFAHLGGMLFGWLVIRYWRGQPPFGGGRRPPRGPSHLRRVKSRKAGKGARDRALCLCGRGRRSGRPPHRLRDVPVDAAPAASGPRAATVAPPKKTGPGNAGPRAHQPARGITRSRPGHRPGAPSAHPARTWTRRRRPAGSTARRWRGTAPGR